ncbi:MAG: hypothetical protein IPP27_08325 [Bacteroidetes bacterium]|nr:hypothetical protein [Bacteroidota bacterium]
MYELIQNGFNQKRSSDVIIHLQSGWLSWSTKTGTSHGSGYRYDTHVPLLFTEKIFREEKVTIRLASWILLQQFVRF